MRTSPSSGQHKTRANSNSHSQQPRVRFQDDLEQRRSLRKGLLSIFNQASDCVLSLEDRLINLDDQRPDQQPWTDEPDYSDGRRRKTLFKQGSTKPNYKLHVEYPSQPGRNASKGRGFISRTKEGKFVLEDNEEDGDEGGFNLRLPPNRFRTRSIAIIAGYSPERLYSNMPPGAFVVESGVYKVGADREWERPEPIYWKQVRRLNHG